MLGAIRGQRRAPGVIDAVRQAKVPERHHRSFRIPSQRRPSVGPITVLGRPEQLRTAKCRTGQGLVPGRPAPADRSSRQAAMEISAACSFGAGAVRLSCDHSQPRGDDAIHAGDLLGRLDNEFGQLSERSRTPSSVSTTRSPRPPASRRRPAAARRRRRPRCGSRAAGADHHGLSDTKEVLRRYYLVEADDLDAALELAPASPAARMGGAIRGCARGRTDPEAERAAFRQEWDGSWRPDRFPRRLRPRRGSRPGRLRRAGERWPGDGTPATPALADRHRPQLRRSTAPPRAHAYVAKTRQLPQPEPVEDDPFEPAFPTNGSS